MQKAMSVKPLSESREWKVLQHQIHDALKDPEFVKALKAFIRYHTE